MFQFKVSTWVPHNCCFNVTSHLRAPRTEFYQHQRARYCVRREQWPKLICAHDGKCEPRSKDRKYWFIQSCLVIPCGWELVHYVPQYLALGGQGTRCSCLFLRNFYNHRQHLAGITSMKLYCWDIHIVCHIGTMKFP